jgi:hypothetical protein
LLFELRVRRKIECERLDCSSVGTTALGTSILSRIFSHYRAVTSIEPITVVAIVLDLLECARTFFGET